MVLSQGGCKTAQTRRVLFLNLYLLTGARSSSAARDMMVPSKDGCKTTQTRRVLFLNLYLLTGGQILQCCQGHDGAQHGMGAEQSKLRVGLKAVVHLMPKGGIVPEKLQYRYRYIINTDQLLIRDGNTY
jgi:hypothetical protein